MISIVSIIASVTFVIGYINGSRTSSDYLHRILYPENGYSFILLPYQILLAASAEILDRRLLHQIKPTTKLLMTI